MCQSPIQSSITDRQSFNLLVACLAAGPAQLAHADLGAWRGTTVVAHFGAGLSVRARRQRAAALRLLPQVREIVGPAVGRQHAEIAAVELEELAHLLQPRVE